jgi:drug/metabolite transporter (DMT)-like permease
MRYPSLFFDPQFVSNVVAGWLLCLLGAGLLLLAAIWWSWAGEWLHAERKPLAWRALSGAGFVVFIVGIFWQIVGYARVGILDW